MLSQFASPCLKWSEPINHCRIPCWDITRKRLFFIFLCLHVSRCGDVYNTSNSCCSVLLFFYCFKCNVCFFFLWNMCLALWFWSDYNTVDGYVQYLRISLVFWFALLVDITGNYAAAPKRHRWESSDSNKTQQHLSVTRAVLICPLKPESSPFDRTIRN